jgi:hypothetical protein
MISVGLALKIPVDYFPRLVVQLGGNRLAYRDLHPQIRCGPWGIAELAAFKLQWNCRVRNIDYARRWGL